MTFCIGFKNSKGVFLVSDSLVTETKNHRREEMFGNLTSTGSMLSDKSLTMSESIQKVLKITDSVLVSFAGENINLIIERLKELKQLIENYGYKPKDAFNSIFIGAGPFPNMTILLAYKEEELLFLESYNLNGDMRIVEHELDEIVQIGSGCNNIPLKEESYKFINDLTYSDFTEMEMLTVTLAGLQSISIHIDTIPSSTGGHYYGGLINRDGIQFADDTLYIFYGVESKGDKNRIVAKNEISLLHLEDISYIYSTYFNHKDGMYIFYLKDLSYPSDILKIPNLESKLEKLKSDYRGGKLTYTVCLNVINKEFIICKKEGKYNGYPFRVYNQENGTMQINLPEDVQEAILSLRHTNVNDSRQFQWLK